MDTLNLVLAAVSSLSTFATAVIVYGAWRSTSAQLQEASRSRQVSMLLDMETKFNSPEAANARRHIYNKLPTSCADFSQKDMEMLRFMMNQMNELGFLVSTDPDDKLLFYKRYGRQAWKLWSTVEPFIKDLRAERGEHYAEYFEILATEGKKFIISKYKQDKPIIYKDEFA